MLKIFQETFPRSNFVEESFVEEKFLASDVRKKKNETRKNRFAEKKIVWSEPNFVPDKGVRLKHFLRSQIQFSEIKLEQGLA